MAGLDALMRRLEKIGAAVVEATKLPQRVADISAANVNKELQRQFAQGVDPYGARYAPITDTTRRLRRGSKTAPPLTDLGNLRAGTVAMVKPGASKLVLYFGEPYGIYHQRGTSRMPRRAIFPDRGIPEKWRAAVKDAWVQGAKNVFAQAFR